MSELQNNIVKLQNLFNKKNFDEIEILSKPLLIKYYDSFEINLISGTAYLANKKPDSAIPLLLKANKINPSSTICLLNISICYKFLKVVPKYKQYLDLAHFSEPNNAEVLCELGFFHLYVNEIQSSISYYEKVLKYRSNNSKFILNLSQAYLRAGYSHKVIEICLQFIKNEIPNSYIYNTLAIAFKNTGDFINAKLYLEKSIKFNPYYFQAHRNLSSLIHYKANNKHLIEMESLLKKNCTDIDLNLALSKAYKDINDKLKYFHHINFANKTIKNQLEFNINNEKNKFSKIKSIFNGNFLKQTLIKDQSLSPIFILGLPRSGTTLTENIISSHSRVYAGGELDIIQNLGDQLLQNMKNFDHIDKNLIIKFREYYLKNLPKIDNKILHITDKMPLNFLWIGLIFTCFPNARVVHLMRNPVATCWSIFNTYFSSNGNPFSYNQSDIYEYYNLYLDLMQHWRKIYSNKIYNLDYEILTTSPKSEIIKLLKYCRLNIEKSCFKPHLNNNVISTASSIQARQKIYTRSSNQWESYKEFISKKILSLNTKNVE